MNQNNKSGNFLEIDLLALLQAYLRRWWLIVLAAVVFGGAFYGYTKFFVTETYQASATIYVNNMKEGTQVDSVSGGSLNTSQQLVSTYISIVKGNRILEKVADELGDNYSVGRLSGMVSAAQVDDTEIFTIYVTSTDPQEAATVANVWADVIPDELSELIEGSSARVIDYAQVPTSRYAPNYRNSATKGAMIGAVFALVILTIVFLLDVRIKTEKDLEDLFDLPVLGQIPEFDFTASSNQRYGKAYEGTDNSVEQTKKDGE